MAGHLPHKGIPPLLTLNKPTTSCLLGLASACYNPPISKVVFTPAVAYQVFYL